MSMAHPRKLFTVFMVFTMITTLFYVPTSSAASGTIHFQGAPGTDFGLDHIASDGELSTKLSGIDIQVYGIDSSGAILTKGNMYYHGGGNDNDWFGYPGLIAWMDLTDPDQSPSYGLTIKSADGSKFKLSSVNFLDWGEGLGETFAIEAFKNGISLGKFTFPGNTYDDLLPITFIPLNTLPAEFDNIDEARLYKDSGQGSYIAINDITIADAVLPAPAITAQPVSATVDENTSASFTVTASDATAYQWQVNTGSGFTNISNAGVYSGATTASLAITGPTAEMNGYLYRVVVTGSTAPAALSSSAALTVQAAPRIISQPSNVVINTGSDATFAVTASNTSSYQWQVNSGSGFTNLTNGVPYNGVTTSTLTITDAPAGLNNNQYRVVLSGATAANVESNAVTLQVTPVPSISDQPSNVTIDEGLNATFAVTAANTSTYQWQVDEGAGFTNLANVAPYSGVTSAALTITGVIAGMNNYKYRVIVKGATAVTASSNEATLTVTAAPSITSQPGNATVDEGKNTTFAVTAANASGYQWQVDMGSGFTNIVDGAPYSGAHTATLTITGAEAGMTGYLYRVIVSGATVAKATSNPATLMVKPLPKISSDPSAITVDESKNTSFTVVATNATAYQWQVNTGSGFTNIANGAPYSGATTATLTITGAAAAMNGYKYRVVASGATVAEATSNAAELTVQPLPKFTSQPSSTTVDQGDTAAFTVVATHTTGYQWQVDTGSGFTNIVDGASYSGSKTTTLTITGATAGMNGYAYRVMASGATVDVATSNTAQLTVRPAPQVTSQPTNVTIDEGANTTFTVAAANATAYQWQVNTGSGFTDIGSGAPYSGATTATLTITGAAATMSGYEYRAIVSGATVATATSNAAKLTVKPAPKVTSQPTALTVDEGLNATFTVTAANATGYQWQVDTGAGFMNITDGGLYSGATTATLTITGAAVAMSSYEYRVIVSGATVATATSNKAKLTVTPAPQVTSQPSDATVDEDANITFTIAATHATGYQWQVNNGSGFTDIANGGPYSGATTATLTITGAAATASGYEYRAIVSGATVATATSNAAKLSVKPAPKVTGQPTVITVDEGTNATFTVVAANATGYQWQVNNGSGFTNIVSGAPYSGATTATLTITGAAVAMSGYEYRVIVSGATVATATSNAAKLTVKPAPKVTSQLTALTVDEGLNATFTVTAANATGYQWQVDTGSGFTNINNGGLYSGATTATLTITGATVTISGYEYRAIVSGETVAVATSNTAKLTVTPAPKVTSQPSDATVDEDENATFTIVATHATGYQWQVDTGSGFTDITNGGPYSGATTATLTITGAAVEMNSYEYRAVASGATVAIVTSSAAKLTVQPAPKITSDPTDITVDESAEAAFTVAAANATGYQWQVDSGTGFKDLVDGTLYSGSKTANLKITGVTVETSGYQYRAIASGATVVVATSNAALLTVKPAPKVTSHPAAITVDEGANATFTTAATNTTGYQWQVNTGSGFVDVADSVLYSGAKTATLTITGTLAEMNGYEYRAIVSGVTVAVAASNAAQLTVNPAPKITSNPSDVTVNEGSNAILSVTAANATTYQWQVDTGTGFKDLTDAAPYSGSKTDKLTITSAGVGISGSKYRVIASGAVAPAATSTSATLTVTPSPYVPMPQPETTTPKPTDVAESVLINGKEEHAGTVIKSNQNGQTATTIVLDEKKLLDMISTSGQHTVITIPVITDSNIAVGEITGQVVKALEEKQAVLEIKTSYASYTLPAQQINIEAISKQMDRAATLQDMKIHIEIAEPTAEALKLVEDAANKGNFQLVVPPVEFTVTAIYKNSVMEISTFNAYVERTILIPDHINPNQITTGVVIDADGALRHVPTKVVQVDGKYYAVINSLTNSTYSIVHHPVSFKDVQNHWAKDAINDMGSRMIVDGVGNDTFSADRTITRAEFVAIMVRALGLRLEGGTSTFSDVQDADWYSRAIRTAVSYGLVSGVTDGTFRPNDKITREQAMTIIAKAMKLTKLKGKLSEQSEELTLRPYEDAALASSWAKGSIADCVQSGIISGQGGTKLAPQAAITRAEVVTMIKRLLEKSDLI